MGITSETPRAIASTASILVLKLNALESQNILQAFITLE